MKSILVVGLGRFGRHVCQKLSDLNAEVMAVDTKESRVNAVLDYVDKAQIGNAASGKFIDSLGVSDFDVCFVCIGDDFQNSLEVTSLLKEKGAKWVVSRAARDVHAKFLWRNGADDVIYPEKELAEWTAVQYSSDIIRDFVKLDDNSAIVEVVIPSGWIGKTVKEVNVRERFNINLLAFKSGKYYDPSIGPDTVFESGKTLLVMGKQDDIFKCFKIK